MKKRILSLFLAVLTVAMALPVVLLPAAAAEEEIDYTDLYVQNGLVYAVDFFKTADHLNSENVDYGALTDWVVNDKDSPAPWEGGKQNVLTQFFHARGTHEFAGYSYIKQQGLTPQWTLGKGYLKFSGDAASNNYININSLGTKDLFTVQYIFKPGEVNQSTPFVIHDNRFGVKTSGDTISITYVNGRVPGGDSPRLADIPENTVSYTKGAMTDLTLITNWAAEENATAAADRYTYQFFVNGDIKHQLYSEVTKRSDLAKTTSVIGYSQATDMELYAMRYYSRVLSEGEIAQNHLADLLGWFGADASLYATLKDNDKQAVAMSFKADTFDNTTKTALEKKLKDTILSIVYDVLMEEDTSAEAATFTQTAKDYSLDIATLRALPLVFRPTVYAAVAEAVALGGATKESLDAVIGETINEILEENYGDYISSYTADYKDFYVKKDNITTAVDFFAAKPEDGKVYISYSTEDYPDAYNYAKYTFYNDRVSAGDANAASYRSKALIWAYVAPTACKNAFSAYYNVVDTFEAYNLAVEAYDEAVEAYDAAVEAYDAIDGAADPDGKAAAETVKNDAEAAKTAAEQKKNEAELAKNALGSVTPETALTTIVAEINKPRSLKDDREVTDRGEDTSEEELYEKYIWKGTSSGFYLYDIRGEVEYPHTNVREYGDGKLICGYNNSLGVQTPGFDSDLTYQFIVGYTAENPVADPNNASNATRTTPNMQLDGFRMNTSYAGGEVTYSSIQYYGYGVTWRNELSTSAILTHRDYSGKAASVTVPYTSSVDLTITMDKGIGDDAPHYYVVTEDPDKLHAQNGKPTLTAREVDPLKEAYNDGPYTNYGRLSMMVYTNGRLGIDASNITYQKTNPASFGNTGDLSVYAVRVYDIPLTLPEIQQNHFADLVGYYNFDLTLFNILPYAKRAALYEKLSSIELGGNREAAEQAFESALYELLYAFSSKTPEAENFRAICEAVGLDVSSLSALSPLSQERVFAEFKDIDPTMPQLAPILQAKLEELVADVVKNYYGETVVHTVADFAGWQIAQFGAPGFRGLYSFNEEAVAALAAKDINITVGLLVGDAAARDLGDMIVWVDDEGNVAPVDNGLTNKVFYSNSAYAADCINKGTAEAPDYFFTIDTRLEMKSLYETEKFYVAYVVLSEEGKDDVVYYIPASLGGKEEAQSIASLSEVALEEYGWSYPTIHKVYNEVFDDELTTVYAGGIVLSEYTIIKTATNGLYIDQLQAMFDEITGVELKVINEADVTPDMKHLVYIGKADNIYGRAYYGIAAQIGNLYFWYNEDGSAEDMVDMAEELFDYYLDFEMEGFDIPDGTNLVRKR